MKLKRLRIHRISGLGDDGLDYPDLAGGLNVVIGLNGSGKTTTCEAIRGLLWERYLKDRSQVLISSTWLDGEQTVTIDREGDRRTCKRGGKIVDLPMLPPADLARCFTITIDDLFEIDDTDRAKAIVDHLAGGYDLPAVRKLVTDITPNQAGKRARKANSDLAETCRHVREVQGSQKDLRDSESTISDLQEHAQEANDAAARLVHIATVRKLRTLLGEIEGAEALLDGFGEGMDRLRGNEADMLDKLREDTDAQDDKLATAERQADDAVRSQADTNLPDGGIETLRLEEQQDHLTALAEAERDLADAQDALGEADPQRRDALGRLGAIDNADRIEALDTTGLNEIDTLHHDSGVNRAALAEVNAQLDPQDEPEPVGDIGAMERGVGILREWLESGPASRAAERKNATLVWILAGLLAVTGVTLALMVNGWWAALVAPALAAVFVARGDGPQAATDRRADRQSAFARTELDAPEAWTPGAVGQRIAELERAIAQARQNQLRADRRREARRKFERLSVEADALETRRTELAQRLGVAAGTGTTALTDLATNLRTFRSASAALETARNKAKKAERTHRDVLEKINTFLAEFGGDTCDTCLAGRRQVRQVQQRAAQYAAATEALAAAQETARDAQGDIAKLRGRMRELFDNAGLDDSDDRALAERLARLEAYRNAKGTLRGLEAQENMLRSQLADAGDLLELSPEALDRHEQELKQRAEARDETHRRIGEIELRVKQASRERSLQDALAAKEEKEAVLDDLRIATLRAAAGEFLLDEITEEFRAESEPRVMQQARDWFARFTHYRYELQADTEVDRGRAAFWAKDNTTQRMMGLNELSRGTRMQLLLAVRLAFAATVEGRTPVPFILDEVLSSSDPERFQAIADCLLTLVSEGRQVFYFTCQPGDAKAWKDAADAAGIDDVKQIDLGQAGHRGAPTAGALSESTISLSETPAPDGASLSDYARVLGVGPLNPAAGAAGAHVAYVLDNAEQLYALEKQRYRRVGPLRALAEAGAYDAYIASDAMARALARADLLDAFAAAWSIGRGRPLTREDLTNAGVSEKFIDAVAELARELDWDAGRVIEAIEAGGIKRFHKKTIEAMRDWMLGFGHLSTEDTLDEDAARTRVLAAANAYVNDDVLTVDEVGHLFETWWRMCDQATETV